MRGRRFNVGKYQGYYLQGHKFSLFKRIYFIISLKILYIMYPTKVISLARSSSSDFSSSSCIACTKFKHWLHIISIDILFKIYKISFPVNWISKSNWMNGTQKNDGKKRKRKRDCLLNKILLRHLMLVPSVCSS